MYEDGKTSFVFEVDGESVSTTLEVRETVGGPIVCIIGGNGGLSITATYTDGELTEAHITIRGETQPTNHTVSAYHMDVTTTADFDAAVNKAAKPSEIGALEYMGEITLVTPEDGTITVGAGETCWLRTDNCELRDSEIEEKYGEIWANKVKVQAVKDVSLPDGLLLAGFSAVGTYFTVYNPTDTAYVFDNLHDGAQLAVALFC